ncbi:hypothetical protein SAMN02745116_01396 [Pilibacter termitis]|uniref:Uncharacterized protein n=1 Tax=Pilibacter termitis TaxID=263852 RepID=A0A1T4NDM0_9ENTE|nr:hypothetical protein [Pilibacter termitis]SJZ77441.1 hypothetical protein SAMN02745116_01396 [Pilibacter termitis]
MNTKEFIQTTKGKIAIGGVVAILAIGGGVFFKVQADYAQEEKVKTTIAQTTKNTQNLLAKAKELFDEKQEFLRKDLKADEIKAIQKELTSSEKTVKDFNSKKYEKAVNEFTTADKEVSKRIKKAETMLDTQTKLNALFTKPVLNGNEVTKEIIIKKDVKTEDIQALEKQKEKTPFSDKVAEIVKNARIQFTDIENAKKALVESEKDKGNETKANNAQNAINKIKNQEVKKELQTKLDPIKKAIKEKKKAEEEKRKAEEKAKAEEQGSEVASNEEIALAKANETGQPVYNEQTGGYVQPTTPQSNGGNSSNSSSSGSTNKPQTQQPSTPQPQQPKPQAQFMGWVKNNGVVVASATFGTWGEAETWARDKFVAMTDNDWDSATNFGVTQLS